MVPGGGAGGWRAGGTPKGLAEKLEKLPDAPKVPLDDILLWNGTIVDFLKMDADGPEV
jgi:hypothetical protein